MMKSIEIRGKNFFLDFAKKVSKKRFIELMDHLKPEVQELGWQELLKATNREETKPKKKSRFKKSEE